MKKTFSKTTLFPLRYILFLFLSAITTIETKSQCPEVPVAEAVKNGNFEAGYTSDLNNPNYFYTDYTRFTPAQNKYSSPGEFFMSKVSAPFNPGSFDGAVDHTTGAGTFYMVDGDQTANRIVWRQVVKVQPNQTYYFSAWVSTLYKSENFGTVAQLQFAINGTPIGPIFSPSLAFNVWKQFYQTYKTNPVDTSITISIVNQRTSITVGNDFAMDDISFINGCQNVTAGVNPNLGVPVSICTNGNVTISSSTSLAGANRIFWKNLDTGQDLVAFYDQPSITVSQPGRYQICVDKDNCLRSDIKEVTTACPMPNLGADFTACNQSDLANITLTASTPAYSTNTVNFTWYYRATSKGNFAPIIGVGNSNTYKPTLGIGEYKVEVISTHPACPSCEVASDTVKIEQPIPPFSYSNNTFCTSSDNLIFSVTDPAGYVGQYDWFTTLTGGNPIASNTTSVTRTKNQLSPTIVGVDSTYFLYVEDVKIKTGSVGLPKESSTVTNAFTTNSNINNRLYFNVKNKVTIDTVYLGFTTYYQATAATYYNISISLNSSSGPIVSIPVTVTIPVTTNGNRRYTFPIAIKRTLDVGTGYYFNVSGTDVKNAGFSQNGTSFTLPDYTSNGQVAGFIQITGGTDGNGSTDITDYSSPMIVNWVLSATGNYPCGRVRVAVTKKCPCIVPDVTLSSSTNSFDVCSGSNLILTASAKPASSNYIYTWYRNNTKIIGSTDSTLLVSSALGSTSYRAKVTNILGSCFGNSPVQTITVLQNVANNTIGKGDTICQGNNAKTIGNSPAENSYGYAWLSSTTSNNSDFSPIIGISTQTLSVSPTQTTHYKRIALNNCKNDTSAAYTVLVDPTLTLGAISVSDSSLCAGNTSTIGTLTPTGGTPSSFKYEWQFSSNGTTWSPSISGATSSTYTPQSLTSSTYYRGIVNSLKCTAISNPLLLKVTQPIVSSSNTISASQIICAGSTPASLTGSVVTGGIQPTTYLWLQSTDNSSWTDAIGTNNVINYAPSALNTTTYFKRVITSTGPCKKDTSSSLTINIDNAVVAGKISASLTSVCSGTSPILNNDMSASGGTDPLAYSWQYSFDGMDWFDINSNTASLNNAPSITSATKFRRIATSSASTCSGTTEAVTVNVDGFAKPGSISALITSFCSGQTPGPIISNTPASNGSITPPSYQWQYLNESIWIDLVGETSDTYSPGPLTSNISFRRRAVFGNATCDTAFTSAVEFSIYPKLNPGAIESGTSTVCEGGDFTVKSVSLPSGGSPNKLFTWNISNEPYTIWRDTLVETANSDLSIFNIQQNTRVRRIAIDDCGNDTSNVFEIRVKTKADPVIRFTAPVPDNLCASNNLTLKVDTLDAGVNPQIIWVYNNVPYTNQGTSFNVPKPLIDGAIVKVFLVVNPNVKCTYAGDSTFDYKLSVKQPISNNIISGDQSKCAGSLFDKITGTKALGDTAVNPYTWQSSNDKFNWTTTNTTEDYDPGSFTNPGDYYFRRIVASSGICGNDTSNLVKISVQPIVYNGKISALDVTRCAGDTLVIENINDPLGGNGSFTFSWVVSTDASNPNSWSPILNEYTKELRIAKDKLDPTKSTFFFRRNIISGICSNFDTTSVIVCQKPIIGSNPKLSPICSNRGSLDKDTADSLNFVVIKTNNPRQPDDDYSPSGEPLVVSPLDPLAFSPKNGKSSILFSAGIATFTYKPNPNFVGNDTVGFNLCSSTNPTSCNTKYFYINVMRRNYKPTAKGEAYSVYRNQEVSGNIFLNDSDLENDTLYAYPSEMSIPSNAKYMLPKFGNITMSSNGDFTYVPNKDIGKGGEIKDTAIFFVTEFSKRPSKYCNSLFNYLDTIIITIKPYRIFVPEGFSPNGDGVNDNFVIASEVPLKMELSIYNRWGNLVYENNDYKNDWNGIPNKGLIVGGDGVPDGTYYIRYNINNGEQEDFRYITISR